MQKASMSSYSGSGICLLSSVHIRHPGHNLSSEWETRECFYSIMHTEPAGKNAGDGVTY